MPDTSTSKYLGLLQRIYRPLTLIPTSPPLVHRKHSFKALRAGLALNWAPVGSILSLVLTDTLQLVCHHVAPRESKCMNFWHCLTRALTGLSDEKAIIRIASLYLDNFIAHIKLNRMEI
jgi:hypothetical protein